MPIVGNINYISVFKVLDKTMFDLILFRKQDPEQDGPEFIGNIN